MPKKDHPLVQTPDLVSSTECTGLMPAGLQNEAEGENYAQLYAIHPPKPVRKVQESDKNG